MRKGISSLCGVVHEKMRSDVRNGDVFIFIGIQLKVHGSNILTDFSRRRLLTVSVGQEPVIRNQGAEGAGKFRFRFHIGKNNV